MRGFSMKQVHREEWPLQKEVIHLHDTLHTRSALVATLHLLRQSIAFLTLATLVRLTGPQVTLRVKKHVQVARAARGKARIQ